MAWKHKEFSGVSSTMFLISQEDNFLFKPLQRGQREEIACAINCVNKNLNETDWYDGENSMRLMWINYNQSIKCALVTKT